MFDCEASPSFHIRMKNDDTNNCSNLKIVPGKDYVMAQAVEQIGIVNYEFITTCQAIKSVR